MRNIFGVCLLVAHGAVCAMECSVRRCDISFLDDDSWLDDDLVRDGLATRVDEPVRVDYNPAFMHVWQSIEKECDARPLPKQRKSVEEKLAALSFVWGFRWRTLADVVERLRADDEYAEFLEKKHPKNGDQEILILGMRRMRLVHELNAAKRALQEVNEKVECKRDELLDITFCEEMRAP